MDRQVVTIADAHVEQHLESTLLAGCRRMIEGPLPEGLLHSELLRGQDNTWRSQSTWRSLDALPALRQAGGSPAALRLLQDVGSDVTYAWFTIEDNLPVAQSTNSAV